MLFEGEFYGAARHLMRQPVNMAASGRVEFQHCADELQNCCEIWRAPFAQDDVPATAKIEKMARQVANLWRPSGRTGCNCR